MIHDPFKVYQLNKGQPQPQQLTTFDGEKSPGSASILSYLLASAYFFYNGRRCFRTIKFLIIANIEFRGRSWLGNF